MNIEQLLALALFAFVSSITPARPRALLPRGRDPESSVFSTSDQDWFRSYLVEKLLENEGMAALLMPDRLERNEEDGTTDKRTKASVLFLQPG